VPLLTAGPDRGPDGVHGPHLRPINRKALTRRGPAPTEPVSSSSTLIHRDPRSGPRSRCASGRASASPTGATFVKSGPGIGDCDQAAAERPSWK
jgi:hypothetical protein